MCAVMALGCKADAPPEGSSSETARKGRAKPTTTPGQPHRIARGNEPHPEGAEIRFDVAFCIDTTGSMKQLIEVARDRIQAIAEFVRTGKPAPSIRFAVVAYRDRGEEYVTLTHGFSPDVAKAQQSLAELRAIGGQDEPEHVVAGLRAAVDELDWDPKAQMKFLFLIGDAPAHLDYGEDSDIEPVLRAAKEKSITIGSIPLGAMADEGKVFFYKVASATGGPTEGISAEAELESTVTTALAERAAEVGVSYETR